MKYSIIVSVYSQVLFQEEDTGTYEFTLSSCLCSVQSLKLLYVEKYSRVKTSDSLISIKSKLIAMDRSMDVEDNHYFLELS